jgi:hypothetical protein
MPKFLNRFIAVLLVPCLLADPVRSVAMTNPAPFKNHTDIGAQALAPWLCGAQLKIKAFNRRTRLVVIATTELALQAPRIVAQNSEHGAGRHLRAVIPLLLDWRTVIVLGLLGLAVASWVLWIRYHRFQRVDERMALSKSDLRREDQGTHEPAPMMSSKLEMEFYLAEVLQSIRTDPELKVSEEDLTTLRNCLTLIDDEDKIDFETAIDRIHSLSRKDAIRLAIAADVTYGETLAPQSVKLLFDFIPKTEEISVAFEHLKLHYSDGRPLRFSEASLFLTEARRRYRDFAFPPRYEDSFRKAMSLIIPVDWGRHLTARTDLSHIPLVPYWLWFVVILPLGGLMVFAMWQLNRYLGAITVRIQTKESEVITVRVRTRVPITMKELWKNLFSDRKYKKLVWDYFAKAYLRSMMDIDDASEQNVIAPGTHLNIGPEPSRHEGDYGSDLVAQAA